jgi:ribosomal protein L24
MFEVGDRVDVNLGKNGTHEGTVYSVSPSQKSFIVHLDNGRYAVVDPWDIFLIADAR